MELIDEEVARILHEASKMSASLLEQHREQLEQLTQALLKDEELGEEAIRQMIGPSAQDARVS